MGKLKAKCTFKVSSQENIQWAYLSSEVKKSDVQTETQSFTMYKVGPVTSLPRAYISSNETSKMCIVSFMLLLPHFSSTPLATSTRVGKFCHLN
jgi:hypothetical protein